ncbi:phage tail protein [Clostridium beijerinckii]|uniref:phage tail protein n=1 Tax=Clostridium beijerinckii TaxID=1520 RepID=UPI00232B3856|nr:phage tail protein [Clostridium beijerinckii]
MLSYIFYNNAKSLDIDLIIEKTPEIPSVNIEYETIQIDGGETLTKIKGFKDIPFKFDFAYFAEPEEYLMKKSRIDNWLLNSIGNYLIYSLDEFTAYKVKQVQIDNTTTTSRILRHFSVTFTCTGLKYMANGLKPIELANGATINNFGSYESKPLVKIYGSGNITFSIGGKSFTINNVVDYVVVDSEIKECYKDSTNKGRDMAGDWPVLPIGLNTISWTGNITKVEITPRWRCY